MRKSEICFMICLFTKYQNKMWDHTRKGMKMRFPNHFLFRRVTTLTIYQTDRKKMYRTSVKNLMDVHLDLRTN